MDKVLPKISVITVVWNNREFVREAIESVLRQTYENIEYIVVDGASTDGTVEIIKEYEASLSAFVSEKDKGLYYAMNRGVELATGDIVGFLNSDDVYASEDVIARVAKAFRKENCDASYGDLEYVDRNNIDKTIRYWESGAYIAGAFRKGWMPPHPTFFVKREIFNRISGFNTDFRIAADYEFMLRVVVRENVEPEYIHEVLVKMRTGGQSNTGISNLIRKSCEDYRAWKVNDLSVSPFLVLRKPLSKVKQFFVR